MVLQSACQLYLKLNNEGKTPITLFAKVSDYEDFNEMMLKADNIKVVEILAEDDFFTSAGKVNEKNTLSPTRLQIIDARLKPKLNDSKLSFHFRKQERRKRRSKRRKSTILEDSKQYFALA